MADQTFVDIQGWQSSLGAKLEALKEDYIDIATDDENFISNYGNIFSFQDSINAIKPTAISLKPVDDLIDAIKDLKFELPDKPEILENISAEVYTNHVFQDAKLDALEQIVKNIYSGFSVGSGYSFNSQQLENAINTALYDFGFALDTDDLEQSIHSLAASWAGDGYAAAPGAFSYKASEVVSTYDRERTAKTDGVFKQLANMIQQNLQWSFEHGIAIEKAHMDFAVKYAEVAKTIITAAVEAYIAEIEKRKVDLQAQIQVITDGQQKLRKLETAQDIKSAELFLQEQIARWSSDITALAAYHSSQAELIAKNVKLSANIADAYKAIFAAWGGSFVALSTEEK